MVVPWRCRSGCVVRYASVTLRCVAVALRVLCSLRCGCVSLCFGPLRFVPGGLVPFRVVVDCRAGPLGTRSVLRRAQNRHFCALFGFGTLIFRPFEHKIEVFVSEWAIFPRFWVVLTQNRGFCAREGPAAAEDPAAEDSAAEESPDAAG